MEPARPRPTVDAGERPARSSAASYSVAYFCILGTVLVVLPTPAAVVAAAWGCIMFIVLRIRGGLGGVGWYLMITVVAVLFRVNIPELPSGLRWAGLFALLAAASAFVVRPIDRTTDFPFVQLFCMVSAVYVAVGVLFARSGYVLSRLVTDEQREVGLWYYGLFLLTVVIGSIAIPRKDRPDLEVQGHVRVFAAVLVIAASYLGSAAIDYADLGTRLGSAGDTVALVRTAGFMGLWWLWLRRELSVVLMVPAVGLVAIDVLNGFGTTLLYTGLATPIAGLCLYVALRRRVPWGLLVVAAMIALSLNAVKSDVRVESRGTETSDGESLTSRGAAIASQSVTTEGWSTERLSSAANRFAYSSGDVLGYIVSVVPSQYPQWDRSTYTYLPLSVIPRALAPWKPVADVGNKFGHDYDLLDTRDDVTSANVPISLEAYVNFGLAGLIVAGLLTGVVLALASRWITLDSPANYLLGSILAGQFIGGVEADTTRMLGLLPLLLLVFIPLTRFMVERPAVESVASPRL
jgi:hypothetical protein